MTVKELHSRLEKLINEGRGEFECVTDEGSWTIPVTGAVADEHSKELYIY